MKIVEPSFEIEWPEEHMVVDILDLIERAARTCYLIPIVFDDAGVTDE